MPATGITHLIINSPYEEPRSHWLYRRQAHRVNPEERRLTAREQRDSSRRLFFCQLEAIETLIWLIEAPEAERVGIHIPSDRGTSQRLCTKLATGGGKTIVIAMVIAWQILNKATYPQDDRF